MNTAGPSGVSHLVDREVRETGEGPVLVVGRDASGALVDIATLGALKRHAETLPPCWCVDCGRPLVAKLGKERAHHFAHESTPPQDACWATAPEGLLHIAAKHAVVRALSRLCAESAVVSAQLPCLTCQSSPQVLGVTRLSPQHRVLVESWGDPRKTIKPDVQVVDAVGTPVLFLEVCDTHACEPPKLRAVEASGVPLLELGAHECLRLESRPLFIPQAAVNLARSPCGGCVEEEARRAAEKRRAEELVRQRDARLRDDERLRAQELEAYQRRLSAARAEAEVRVLARESKRPRIDDVAWCHVAYFRGDTLLRADFLVVSVVKTLGGAPVLRLTARGRPAPVAEWSASDDTLFDVFNREVRPAAQAFAGRARAALGAPVDVETFGGFQCSLFEDAPPEHLRLEHPQKGGWVTVFRRSALALRLGEAALTKLSGFLEWTSVRVGGREFLYAKEIPNHLGQPPTVATFQILSARARSELVRHVEAETRLLMGDPQSRVLNATGGA